MNQMQREASELAKRRRAHLEAMQQLQSKQELARHRSFLDAKKQMEAIAQRNRKQMEAKERAQKRLQMEAIELAKIGARKEAKKQMEMREFAKSILLFEVMRQMEAKDLTKKTTMAAKKKRAMLAAPKRLEAKVVDKKKPILVAAKKPMKAKELGITEYLDASAVGHERITMSWKSMNLPFTKIKLSVSNPEYRNVARYFAKTANNEILSITRIQNNRLGHLYDQTRNNVSKSRRNNGKANEEFFWHGSKLHDGFEKIIPGGFDCSLSKTKLRSIWLSTNSKYSADNYCFRNPNGTKEILLVRCALGYMGSFEDGTIKVDSHHAGETSIGHVRKDDQVGGGKGNRYVVKMNNQVYPAYVLKFR